MSVTMRTMLPSDAPFCAAIACVSPIGKAYGLTENALTTDLISAAAGSGFSSTTSGSCTASGNFVIVAEIDGKPAGFAWVDPRGAFSSAPYLRLIVVDEHFRGSGVGSALLLEFEHRTMTVGRDFCLLVSDFNTQAIAFYEQHGYRKAGALPEFAQPGITEILMVKPRRSV
ncbi:MAG: GNAT family N-acetyltransferase [Spirochaetes bacterium]|nr:GNAT family N-acetyltransferase [Spirochaetota bacterium]